MSGEESRRIVRFSPGTQVWDLERLERAFGPIQLIEVNHMRPPSATAVLDTMAEHDVDFVLLDYDAEALKSGFIKIAVILEVISGEVILPNHDQDGNFVGYRLLQPDFAAAEI